MLESRGIIQLRRKQIYKNDGERLNEVISSMLGRKPWGVYGSDYRMYEKALGLSKKMLPQFIKDRQQSGQAVYGLDVGSDTTALCSLGISGVAVGLADVRNRKQIEKDEKTGRRMVAGDVLHTSTWHKIKDYMEELGIDNRFGLILSVPEAGLKKITDDPLVQFGILQRMWRLLSPNRGMLLALTEMETEDYYLSSIPLMFKTRWINHLNKIGGMEASILRRGIKLVKHQNAPEKLPFIF